MEAFKDVLKQLSLFSTLKEGEWAAILGLIGSIIASWFGGFDKGMMILLGMMTVDYISGMIVAGIFKASKKTESGGLSSKIGFIGIMKKVLMLLMVIVAHGFDLLIGNNYARDAVIFTLITNEIVSFVENCGLVDKSKNWIPPALMKAIDILKEKSDPDQGEEKDGTD